MLNRPLKRIIVFLFIVVFYPNITFSQISHCSDAIKETIEKNGNPEITEKIGKDIDDPITLKYPSEGYEITFVWNEKYQECRVSTFEIPLSQKGLSKRVKELQKKHPGWSSKICRKIIENKIILGMTKEQVIASWGEPSSKHRSVTKTYIMEIWWYGNDSILFDNGKLAQMNMVNH